MDEVELTPEEQEELPERLLRLTNEAIEFLPAEWESLMQRWRRLIAVQRTRVADGQEAVLPPLNAAFIGKQGRGQDAAILALAQLLGRAENLGGRAGEKTSVLETIGVLLGDLPRETSYSTQWGGSAAGHRIVAENVFSASPGFTAGYGRLLIVDVDRRLELLRTLGDTGADRTKEVESRWRAGLQTLKALAREPWVERAILLVGDSDLDRLLKENKDLEAAFGANIVRFEPLTVEQGMEVLTDRLESKGYLPSAETLAKLQEGLARLPGDLDYRSIGNLVVKIASHQAFRIREPVEGGKPSKGLYVLEPSDVPLEGGGVTREEILDQLNQLVGLGSIKDELARLVELAEARARRRESSEGLGQAPRNYHFIFRGPPGTGKTTVARLMGDLFYAAGLLPKGHLVERDRAGLVGRFLGNSEINLAEAVDEAKGGVLFIDEAYSLSRDSDTDDPDDYGQVIIDALVQRLYESPGSFSCVLAGYGDEMREFLQTNRGLASRFNHELVFPSFLAADLATISLERIAEQGLKVADEQRVRPALEAAMAKLINASNPETFGNARTAIEIADRATETALVADCDEVLATHLEEAVEHAIEMEISRSEGTASPSARGPASPDSIKMALENLEGLSGSAPADRGPLKLLIESFRNEEPKVGFVHGLPRAIADFYFSTDGSDEETLRKMAEALLALYREVGLLDSSAIMTVGPDKWPIGSDLALLDELFETASTGGALFIPDVGDLLTSAEGEPAVDRELLVTNLIDLMHRTRYDLAIFMGVPDELAETDQAIIRLLQEFEYRL